MHTDEDRKEDILNDLTFINVSSVALFNFESRPSFSFDIHSFTLLNIKIQKESFHLETIWNSFATPVRPNN